VSIFGNSTLIKRDAYIATITMREVTKRSNFGVTLPSQLTSKLDKIRGDVSRSRYIMRLVEKEIAAEETSNIRRENNLKL
jgi:hypothetical protein